MANKEYTIFGLDCSSHMNVIRDDEISNDFQLALDYIVHQLVEQAVKNRKSDRFALLLYTSNSFKLLFQDRQINLKTIKEYHKACENYFEEQKGSSNDENFDVISVIKEIIDHFKVTIRYKFIRKAFLITNGALPIKSANQDLEEMKTFLQGQNIEQILILINNKNTENTNQDLEKLSQKLPNTYFYKYYDIITSGPPSKLISPRVISESCLTFANSKENLGVNLNVQVYPAVKLQNAIHGHEHYLDKNLNSPVKIDHKSEYYIRNTDSDVEEEFEDENSNIGDDNNTEKEIIDRNDAISAFKISNFEVVALVDELIKVSTLKTSPAINIIGFINQDNLLIDYLTEEAVYIVPSSKSRTESNKIGFESLAKSLIDLNYIALVRYVAKDNTEVEICAGFPQKVMLDNSCAAHILVLIRLAMKEDVKKGRFYPLSKLQVDEDKEILENTDDLMEQFIKCNKLKDKEPLQRNTLDNKKIRQVKNKSFTEPIDEKTSLESILLSTNPSTIRFNHYFTKTLMKWMKQESSLVEFLQQDDFIQNNLTNDERYTLFNKNNILDAKENCLYTSKYEASQQFESKLIDILNVDYKLQGSEKIDKKAKKTYDFYGETNEAHNGKYDEYFDINDILK